MGATRLQVYNPRHSQLEIILIHIEAALAFNVSREVAELGLKLRCSVSTTDQWKLTIIDTH